MPHCTCMCRGGISQQICRGGEYVFPFAVSHTSSPALLSCSSGGSWSVTRLSQYRQLERKIDRDREKQRERGRERQRKIHRCRGESLSRTRSLIENELGFSPRYRKEARETEVLLASYSLEGLRRNENDAPVSSVTRQLERLFNHVQSARNRRRRSWAAQRREPRRLTVGACAEFPWRNEHVH